METIALDALTRAAAFPASIRYFGASREHAIGFGDAFLHITLYNGHRVRLQSGYPEAARCKGTAMRKPRQNADLNIRSFDPPPRFACAGISCKGHARARCALARLQACALSIGYGDMQCRRCAARATTVAPGAPLRGAEHR
jgi:hypothetical protein